MKYIAKTFEGFEDILAYELKELGAENIEKSKRAVYFEGSKENMYKINYCSRLALRILQPIKEFHFQNEQDFYEQIKSIEFLNYFDENKTIKINQTVKSEILKNSNYAKLKAKDAIVDYFKEKTTKRPNIDKENAQIVIDLYINGDKCNISLDTSGEALYKRGYRKKQYTAPLNEVLAAGLVILSQWNVNEPLVDFMCGSGTIIIEAALWAYNIPPQICRKNFAFFYFRDFEKKIWDEIVTNCNYTQKIIPITIKGSDISQKAIDIATESLACLKLSSLVDLKKIDFRKTKSTKPVHIITNPPYWKRIAPSDNPYEFYQELGNTLKNNYKNSIAWILSGNKEALKKIGLKPSQKYKFFNGEIETEFVKYLIF